MISMLAQTGGSSVLDTITKVFARADTLAHPKNLILHLQTLSVVWSVVFLVAGLLCMFNGYKFYRTVTVVFALVIGLAVGYALGLKISAPYIVSGCVGLLLAVACFPMMKYAVAILGGLCGAWVGANTWTAVCHLVNRNDPLVANASASHHWVGALVGLILFGMLAFILFKLAIVLFTSVSGSTLAVLGLLALLLQFKPWQDEIRSGLSTHAMIIPLLVFVLAIIGLILQESSHSTTVSDA